MGPRRSGRAQERQRRFASMVMCGVKFERRMRGSRLKWFITLPVAAKEDYCRGPYNFRNEAVERAITLMEVDLG